MMSAMRYAQPGKYSILQGQGVPDGVLVGQALAGDQLAFELLVSRYHRPLVSCIRGFLKDNEQVSDVLQHVFLQLYLSLPVLLRNVSLRAWLFQVARHRCLDELRKRRCKAAIPFSTLEVSFNCPPALFQATELLGDRAGAQHPEEYREDLLLPLSAALA